MTKRECAIIMAHTGVCMLTGEDFKIFNKYIEEILNRPVFTHELGNPRIADEIKEKSTEDFLNLCRSAETKNEERVLNGFAEIMKGLWDNQDIELVIKIDEDTYKDIKRGKIYTSVRDVPLESVVAITNAPTIIEADKENRK